MSITFNRDGSVMARDEADPSRTATISAGTSPADRDTQLAAFFGPPPEPAMPDLSDRQFARGLWEDGIISYTDYLGFIGPGAIPAPLAEMIKDLPDDDTGRPTLKKEAVGFLTGAQDFKFAHFLVEYIRLRLVVDKPEWTREHLIARWLAWSQL